MSMTCLPRSASPNSSTSVPSVFPAYGSFWARVLTSVTHVSPILAFCEGTCFQPSRSNLCPPHIASCKDASNLMGCKRSTNYSYKHKFLLLLRSAFFLSVTCKALICEQSPFDLATQPFTHDDPFNAVNLPSPLEKDDRRYTIDFPLAGGFVVLVRVDPGEHHPSLKLFADGFKLGILYLTCTTILRWKVHQDRLLRLENLFRNILV